ncbi:hypothetical protein ACIP4X_17870 [Streptomyces sp. NPDC088817]|uniref:hypothetical protein n=1 Tax=unclassified Streptomyces TaxID=2593676 RepID=UPI002DD89EEC|nr:hypothetical protein [Streptomyces sp. NBC_01788]WSB29694.1 hypothetical protein OIE49_29525 [Streptomyces sp. NBC_01788]
MTIEIPASPVEDRPAGFCEFGEQAAVLRGALTAAGIELGTYERSTIEWLSRWEWATVATIASWVARAATAREPAPSIALPDRFNAAPDEIDQHLRRILADDVYLRYQQAIVGLAVTVDPDEHASDPLPEGDPLAYGPTGIRCGCGKDAHSNLVPCAPAAEDNPQATAHAVGDDEPQCVRCGCTDSQACPGGCHWVANRRDVPLCSACATPAELAVSGSAL